MIVVLRKKRVLLVLTIAFIGFIAYGLKFSITTGGLIRSNTQPITGGIVMLDPGHGGEDPGAVSDYSGVPEKNINLNIALKIKELLEQKNYTIIMTRTEDKLEYQTDSKSITLKRREDLLRRKSMMDSAGADIAVSIHLNKFPDTKVSGAQTFYPESSPESQKLAANIQKSLNQVAFTNARNALSKKETIIILKNIKIPTVIVECGFLSNEQEEKRLVDNNYQDKIAVSIKEGIEKYFEEIRK